MQSDLKKKLLGMAVGAFGIALTGTGCGGDEPEAQPAATEATSGAEGGEQHCSGGAGAEHHCASNMADEHSCSGHMGGEGGAAEPPASGGEGGEQGGSPTG